MKRVLFLLLAAAFAGASPALAQAEANPVAQIGDAIYTSLQDAFNALSGAQKGGTVTLLRDVTATACVSVPEGASGTFDLNGFTYTYVDSKGNFNAIIVQCNSAAEDAAITLTVTDSSAAQTGTIRVTEKALGCIAATNANVTITGGRFVQAGSSGYAINATDGLVIAPAEGRTVECPSGGVSLRRGSWQAIKDKGVVIAGGTFVAHAGASYALYSGNGTGATSLTVTGGTFTGGAGGHIIYLGSDRDVVTTQVSITGGTFNDGDLYIAANAAGTATFTVSGGNFSTPVDEAYLAEGHTSIAIDGQTVVASGTAENPAAAIERDGAYSVYATLAAALLAVPANTPTTIVVLRDIDACGYCKIDANKDVTIDLNDHTVTFAKPASVGLPANDKETVVTNYPCFNVKPQGRLTLAGTGTIVDGGEIWAPIWVQGSGAADTRYACGVTVGEGVTLKGWCGIAITSVSNAMKVAYNASVSVAGTIKATTHGLYVNGNVTNTEAAPEITVTGIVNSQGDGIYAAGYAKWELAGDVRARTALVVRSGDITITDGTYTSTMTDTFEEVTVDKTGGAVGTGAAISVSTAEGYAGATAIDIRGGTFSSANGPAVYEYAAPETAGGAAPASQVALTVTDGTFRSSAGHQPLLLTAMADKHVVSGGLFGTALSEDCCAYGYVPVTTPNAEGLYTVTRNALVHSVVFRADGTAVECDSMEDAYEAFYRDGNTKGTIRMLTDKETGSPMRLLPTGVDMTLDLNGKTLTFTNQTGFDVVRTTNTPAVALTITDSSAEQTGTLTHTGSMRLGRMIGGTLTITGGRFVHEHEAVAGGDADAFLATEGLTIAPAEGRTVEFRSGHIRIEPSTVASLQAQGVTISGGTFTSKSGEAAILLTDGYGNGAPIQNVSISGATFVGDGEAIRIANPATVTVEGGDFTDDTIAVTDAGATLLLKGGDLEGATLTGAGTVSVGSEVTDLSMSTIADLGALAVSGDLALGANRPTGTDVSASAEAVLSVAATETELNAGKVAVFAANGDAVPAKLSLALANVPEGQAIVDAETVAVDGTLALTFTALPEDVAADKALVATLLPYLEAQAVHNVATLTGTTDGGTQTLTLAEVSDALEVFRLSDGLVTADAENNALTVAYDFGVASAQVGTDGSLTVVARVQGADGKSVTFAPGTTAQLIDAANAEAGPLAEVVLGEDASGTVAFTGVALPEAGKALRLAVRILPPARE